MFFLYDMFQDENALSSSGNNTSMNNIEILNGIYNHLNLLNKIDISTNKFDTTIPTDWTQNTLMDASFNGTINAGSVKDILLDIDHLDVQRTEQGKDDWITIQQIVKDEEGNLGVNFILYDTYEKNNTLYTYRILPVSKQGDSGYAIQQDVLSSFNEAYIADASHIYKITNEYSLNRQTNQVSAIYTPYGSKYPYVAFNAETKYDSGEVTAVLLAPTSVNNSKAYLDRQAQTDLVNEFNSWLANGRAKILKDFNGNYKIGTVTDPVSNSYYKELGNGLASTTFNFVEVGEFTQEYVDKLGLKNKFPIQFS